VYARECTRTTYYVTRVDTRPPWKEATTRRGNSAPDDDDENPFSLTTTQPRHKRHRCYQPAENRDFRDRVVCWTHGRMVMYFKKHKFVIKRDLDSSAPTLVNAVKCKCVTVVANTFYSFGRILTINSNRFLLFFFVFSVAIVSRAYSSGVPK